MIKYQFIGTQALNAYTVVKCYKVIPGNNITIDSDNKLHSMPIGTIFSHVSSKAPAGAVLLSGQTLDKSDYTEFYEYIINDKDNIRVISNDEYEEENNTYGFCGAFVIGENAVRLPNYNNTFLMGSTDKDYIGTAISAALPNITGSSTWQGVSPNNVAYGAFESTVEWNIGETYGHDGAVNRITFGFDASNCSPIYSNDCTTVQPPAICVNYYIQVYNSTYTPNNVEAAVKDLSNVAENIDFVIESVIDDETGSWYRKYRSGWVEQGGIYEPTTKFYQESHTITLPVPLTKLYDSKFTLVYEKFIGGAINFYLKTLPTAEIINTIDIIADSSSASVSSGKLLWSVQGKYK